MKVSIVFCGIDDWNRPIFRDDRGRFYGCTDKLFDYRATEEEVLTQIEESDVSFFGYSFGCEPMGSDCEVTFKKNN